MDRKKHLRNLIAFVQRKSFIWGPEPEIYNGAAGFYTYAPLGKLLKNNIENNIRTTFKNVGFWEVECPTILPEIVWKASGHLDGFTDPIISCSKCKANFRVDNLLEEKYHDENFANFKDKDYLDFIEKHKIKCPNCGSEFDKEIKQHNLMMKTTIGLDSVAYNRPETATTTYLPFLRYLQFFRDKLPFGVFQIGKAYRNEISPRQFVLRCREFTQAEAQLFIFKEEKNNYSVKPLDSILPLVPKEFQKSTYNIINISLNDAIEKKYLKNKAYASTLALAYELFKNIGIPENKIRLRQHLDDEKAFYADDAWDIEINLNSFGWTEVCGIHDRTDYDLKKHSEFSKTELIARDSNNKKETPHVIEIAFGVDRPVFAILDLFYSYSEEKKQDILTIPSHIAPIKVSVLPLVKNLSNIGEKIYNNLKKKFECTFDTSGSIGRRYARNDEIGTPFCITIDYQTKEDNTVTIRERDSTKQKRIKIENLENVLSELLSDKIKFDEIIEV